METKKETKKTATIKKENVASKKRISKAWKAAMKSQGSVEIVDMDALFKPICY
jgi:hypothetical protein